MKVWQISIGTEDGGSNVECLFGIAETAQEAIEKAMQFAKKNGLKGAYPSSVVELDEQAF